MKRIVVPEIMDSPTLDRAEHIQALAGLRRVNEVSNAAKSMLRPILAFARRHRTQELRMLDLACGSGDVPLTVVATARDHGIPIHLTLTDKSPLALEQAQSLARAQNLDITTIPSDIVSALPDGPFDIVTNSLFLHHLDRPEVLRVLSHMRTTLRPDGLLVINDLRRSHAGWLLAWTACRLLTKSPIVRFDGPASVHAAWTLHEMQSMATEASLTGAKVTRAWPCRMMLTWQQTESATRHETKEQTAEVGV